MVLPFLDISPDTHGPEGRMKGLICVEEGCGRKFSSQRIFTQHFRHMHSDRHNAWRIAGLTSAVETQRKNAHSSRRSENEISRMTNKINYLTAKDLNSDKTIGRCFEIKRNGTFSLLTSHPREMEIP